MTEKKKSSAYLMAALVTVIMFTALGSVSCFGVVLYSISKDLGESIAAVTIMGTLSTLLNFVASASVGKVLAKLNAKKTLLIAVIIVGCHEIGYSFCTKLWQLYIFAAISGFGVGFLIVPATVIINQWFATKKNTMMSIVFAGGSVGGFLYILLGGQLLNAVGWQGVYRCAGISVLVLGLIMLLILKQSPEEVGQLPYGYDEVAGEADAGQAADIMSIGVDQAVAKKSACYWLICLACLLVAGATYTVSNLGATVLTIRGMDASNASVFLSAVSAISIVGSVVSGIVTDKFGLKVYLLYAGLLAVVGMIVFISGGISLIALGIAAVMFGMCSSISVNISAFITQACFGPKDYQALSGLPQGSLSLGGSIVVIISAIGEALGWTAALATATICTACGVIIMFICLRITPLNKMKAENNNS